MAANWTQTQVFNQLNGGERWSGNTITYAFPTSAGSLYAPEEAPGFRAVSASQQGLMVLAMATWDDLMPQAFAAAAPGNTNIEFGFTSSGIGYAHAYFPNIGSVWFNASEDSLVRTSVGEYGFQTYIHEIGHALGLNHMGDYNGNGNWAPSSFQDSVVLSIMSYFGPRYAAPNYSAEVMQADWVDAQGVTHSPQTPMLNDIDAIQRIYGTSTTTRLDNTVYGFASTVGGPTAPIFDFTQNANPILTVFDSGGTDTLNFSGWSTPGRIDLHAGAFSSVNDMTNNIAIAYNTVIENAIGGGGSDVIIGNDAANRLEGGAGNDELYGSAGDDMLMGGSGSDKLEGGEGSDTAVFENNLSAYTVAVTGGSITITGGGSSDTLTGIELFQFADGLRTLAQLLPGTDGAAPVLQALSPADNASTAAIGANLVLSFNEPVKAGNGSISIFNADGTLFRNISAGDGGQVRFNGNTVTIDPAVNLVAGRSYHVTVSADAFTDLAGNAWSGIAGTTAWNFSTGNSDASAPQLVAISPADDAGAVATDTHLLITFNETVFAGVGNIVIRSGNQVVRSIPVGDTSQVTLNGSTVTVNLAQDLAPGTAYSVTLDAGSFRDAAENHYAGLSGSTAWNFSTASTGGTTDDYPFDTGTTGRVTVGGAATTGRIETAGDRDLLRVDLTAGVTYTFNLQRQAGGLSDPYLALFNPTVDTIVADDDDSGGGGNSRIVYTAAVTGPHYLAVLDFYDTGTGGYTLSAGTQDSTAPTLQTLTPADNNTQVNAGADLVLGFSETVVAGNGRIRIVNAENQVVREIRASDTTAVRINGSTVTIDPGANLPANTALHVLVDADAFRDASGNHFAGIGSASTWNFRTAATSGTDDYPLDLSTTGVVPTNGSAVAGRIDHANDGDLFAVTLQAGVTYRFDMLRTGGAVDPYLALYGPLPEVEYLDFADDISDSNLNAQLFFTPTTSGTYYLAAFDYAEATGSYTLSASRATDDIGDTPGTVRVNAASTSGKIDMPGDVDLFSIQLVAGTQVTMNLQRKASAQNALADPYLVLLDDQGEPLAYDDDTGGDLDAEITVTVTQSGTYYLAAADFDTGQGEYTLTAFTRNLVQGSAQGDALTGTSGADTLNAGAGNDALQGGAGNDILDGGDGIDYAVFNFASHEYLIEWVEGGWALTATLGNEGRDLLYGVERLAFDDNYVALDLDGAAGITARILGVVFGPESVRIPEYVGIGLDLLDSGMDPLALMQLALDARLGSGASPAAVVNLLYGNLVGALPSTAERNYYVGLITSGEFSAAELAAYAADTDLNADNINLVGLSEVGLIFV